MCGRKNGANKRTSNRISNGISITFEQWCKQNGDEGQRILSEWAQENIKNRQTIRIQAVIKFYGSARRDIYFQQQ